MRCYLREVSSSPIAACSGKSRQSNNAWSRPVEIARLTYVRPLSRRYCPEQGSAIDWDVRSKSRHCRASIRHDFYNLPRRVHTGCLLRYLDRFRTTEPIASVRRERTARSARKQQDKTDDYQRYFSVALFDNIKRFSCITAACKSYTLQPLRNSIANRCPLSVLKRLVLAEAARDTLGSA